MLSVKKQMRAVSRLKCSLKSNFHTFNWVLFIIKKNKIIHTDNYTIFWYNVKSIKKEYRNANKIPFNAKFA